MTEALFSITPAGKLISARYYTITRETMEKKILSDELLLEVLHRSSDQSGQVIKFIFEDLQVEILEKKLDYVIDFFVSRDIPAAGHGRQRPLDD